MSAPEGLAWALAPGSICTACQQEGFWEVYCARGRVAGTAAGSRGCNSPPGWEHSWPAQVRPGGQHARESFLEMSSCEECGAVLPIERESPCCCTTGCARPVLWATSGWERGGVEAASRREDLGKPLTWPQQSATTQQCPSVGVTHPVPMGRPLLDGRSAPSTTRIRLGRGEETPSEGPSL